MAEIVRKLELDVTERLWLREALKFKIVSLTRARSKEISGGEVYALRGREIAALNSLLEKVS